jgi:hypothetical protein
MSLSLEKIESYARAIMNERKILNKAVILCEGTPEVLSEEGNKHVTHSPRFYKQLETAPDSSFYSACLPKHMRSRFRPIFFNCGGRADVLKIFVKLHELHQDSVESYLTLEKLFVLIDVDMQKAEITETSRNLESNTEEVFHKLYNALKINQAQLKEHVIFTTGLIHKEAYFLLPELKEFFKDYRNQIFYKNAPLDLTQVYNDIIHEFEEDKDLAANFEIAQRRLAFSSLDSTNLSSLKHAFHQAYQQAENPDLIPILFLIRKAKPYWKELSEDSSNSPQQFHEQLSLAIARFYSDKNDENFHLTAIFNAIYER